MNWKKKEISIQANKRGFSLITKEIIKQLPFIENYNIGILHLFIKHTSASITINENCDSTVRDDLKTHFDKMVPEKQKYYTHIFEGPDDMPAHIKSSIIGNNLNIPISKFLSLTNITNPEIIFIVAIIIENLMKVFLLIMLKYIQLKKMKQIYFFQQNTPQIQAYAF